MTATASYSILVDSLNINLTNIYENIMGTKKKIVMSIAGSDPSGGAGVQADLKTFTALGLHGTTAVTCITAQNTKGVKAIHKLPIKIIEKQIDLLLEDMKPDAVKTGMLYDQEIVKSVTKKIRQHNLRVVVDPVIAATSSDSLSNKNLTNAIKKELLPITYILTPNIDEASVLTDKKICNLDDVKKACEELYKMGAKYILVKGGHLEGKYVQDVFYDGESFSVFSLPRIPNKKAHGSGCTLSALITGYLALGETPVGSVEKSKHVLWNMINEGYRPGKGFDVLNHEHYVISEGFCLFPTDVHFEVWQELNEAVDKLLSFLTNEYVAEVGVNIGYALPSAEKLDDVCAINGRITKTKDTPRACGPLEFGSSKHIASVVLAAMSFDSSMRCVMNIRYSNDTIKKCKKLGFKVGSFDRLHEPGNVKSTMEWGTIHAIRQLGYVPDLIYDAGSIGKEPMIRILGKNPERVVKKINKITKFH